MLLGLSLVAAAPPTSILGTPVLVVYPFSVNGGDVSKEAGSRLAIAIATQIGDLGGVDVKPATPGVERQAYLDAARAQGADDYIAGYLTPLGDGVSLVEQLVSTVTGIIVYSNTAQVRTYADAAGQGDVLRDAIIRHQTRNLGAYAAPPPSAATPTPGPAASGAAAQENLGRLFGRRQKVAAPPKPSPSSTAQATAVATRATVAPTVAPTTVATVTHGSDYSILAIDGSAASDRRSFTGAAIRNDLIANHRRVELTAGTRESACMQANIGTVVGGTLSTRNHTILGQRQTITTLDFIAYDCTGKVVYRQTFARDAQGDWKSAIDAIVARAVSALLHGPSVAPHS